MIKVSNEEIAILDAHESSGTKDRAVLQEPPLFVRGDGARLWDSNGREYIDFLSGGGTANAGYGNREIQAAIQTQAATGVNHVGSLLLTPVKARLIERLIGVVPDGLTRVHLAVTGGEAVEVAFKMARVHTGRQNIVAFWGGYHGATMGAMAASASRSQRDPFFPIALGVTHFPYPYPYRNPFGVDPRDTEQVLDVSVNYLEAALDSPASGLAPVAALVVEPIQGVGGIVVPPSGFLARLRQVCDRHSILLIVDEIFCGFGRTGRWFGCQHDEALPDLMVISKGLSSALPISAVVGREEVMAQLPVGFQSTTYEGNPIACSAAIANLDYLKSIRAPEKATAIGQRIAKWTQSTPASVVGEARGKGAFWGLEIVEPGSNRPAPDVAAKIVREGMVDGLLLFRGGHYKNVVGIMPPIPSTDTDLDEGLTKLGSILEKLGG